MRPSPSSIGMEPPRLPASEKKPLCFCYSGMALILKLNFFVLVSTTWQRRGRGQESCLTPAVPVRPCCAICETPQQLQHFVWYSQIKWPKSCIYTQNNHRWRARNIPSVKTGRGYEFSYITNTRIRVKSKRKKIHLVNKMRIIKRLDRMSAGRNIQTDHLNIRLQTSELNTGTVERV